MLWDAERGAWFDYNLVTHSKHFEFYPSNLAPVWAQCYSRPEMGEKAVQYLKVGGHCSVRSSFSLQTTWKKNRSISAHAVGLVSAFTRKQ